MSPKTVLRRVLAAVKEVYSFRIDRIGNSATVLLRKKKKKAPNTNALHKKKGPSHDFFLFFSFNYHTKTKKTVVLVKPVTPLLVAIWFTLSSSFVRHATFFFFFKIFLNFFFF